MPNKQTRAHSTVRKLPLAQKFAIVRRINERRKAHPKELLHESLKAVDPQISDGNYFAWQARMRLAELEGDIPPQNGSDTTTTTTVEHFPLAIIPEKPPKKVKAAPTSRRINGDDRVLASQLLEVALIAARLLGRDIGDG